MEWIYNGRAVTEEDLEGKVAFVYLITNMTTGRMYIGKKRLETVRRTKVKNKTKRKVVRKDSGWRSYWGSNATLLAELETADPNNYKREITRLCSSLSESSYYEAKNILVADALLSDQYYNDWCTLKVTRKHLKKLTS